MHIAVAIFSSIFLAAGFGKDALSSAFLFGGFITAFAFFDLLSLKHKQ